jgi:two-component system nitrate/nitrite response regulator NarL
MMKHILVVDDNKSIRKLVCQMLSKDRRLPPCVEAENGLEAVEKAAAEVPDLVVMDFSMPVMNGLEAAKRISRSLPRVGIVLVTLHSDLLPKDRIADSGVSAVISKDRAARELVPIVCSLLGFDCPAATAV